MSDDWTNSKLYKIARSDGGVSIAHVREDIVSFVRKWQAETGHTAVEVQGITKADIPTDRHFRDAWGHDLKVDMPKAGIIHMDRIRLVRDEKLKKLDIETLKGNDVEAEKQILRDLPQNFDLTVAATPEELKSLWPAELL